MTALIEGFLGFVWFGWGQANASAGLSVGLAVAGVHAEGSSQLSSPWQQQG